MESMASESEVRFPSLGLDSYNGTRGSSGPSASADAAAADYEHGVTNRLQWEILGAARERRYRGITVSEAREFTQEHHGRVSSALTKLHIAGHLVALEARRGNAGIYVAPEFVDGRAVRPYHRQTKSVDEERVLGVLLQHYYNDSSRARIGAYGGCGCGWLPTDGDLSYKRHLAREIAKELS